MARIRRAPPGTLAGRRLAIFAVVAGTAALLLQMWALEWSASKLRRSTESELERVVDAAMAAAQAGDHTAVADLWADSAAAPSRETVVAFGNETLRRYGRYRSFTRTIQTPSRAPDGGGFEVAVVFSFSSRELTGSVRYALVPSMSSYLPLPRVREVVIDDQRGPLSLGGSAASAATADRDAGTSVLERSEPAPDRPPPDGREP